MKYNVLSIIAFLANLLYNLVIKVSWKGFQLKGLNLILPQIELVYLPGKVDMGYKVTSCVMIYNIVMTRCYIELTKNGTNSFFK